MKTLAQQFEIVSRLEKAKRNKILVVPTSTKAIYRATDYSNQSLNKTFAAAFSKKTDNDYICTRENVEKKSKKMF